MRNQVVLAAAAAMVAAFGLCMAKIQGQQAQIERLRADIAALTKLRDAKQATRGHERGEVVKGPRVPAPKTRVRPTEDAASGPPPLARQEPTRQPEERAPKGPEEESEELFADPEEESEELLMAFLTEAPDPSWAREAERVVQDKLRESMPEGSAARAVECRSSMCRIESVHQDAEAYEQFAQNLFKDPETRLWAGDAFSELPRLDDRGRIVIVTYVAREGNSLPLFNPSESP